MPGVEKLAGGGGGPVAVDVGDGDAITAGGETLGEGLAQAAGGAGDENGAGSRHDVLSFFVET